MGRILYLDCFSGASGDMLIGALLDAGLPFDTLRTALGSLALDDECTVSAEQVSRSGIAATKFTVAETTSDAGGTHRHRHLTGITTLVERSALSDASKQRANRLFRRLAETEATIHQMPVEKVHLHEVGALDSIVDVVGSCAAMEVLGIDEVWSSSIATGRGMVRSAHGIIPVPAPAVVGLLVGAPTHGIDVPFELTTPTGAALMAATVTGWGPMPAMLVESVGFGAGDRDLDGRPNLTQVVVGTSTTPAEPGQPVSLLEVNVDDATGETLAHAVAMCLEAAAHNAWVTPIVMKKGRPAHVVSALCDPVRMAEVAAVLTAETGSLGVRGHAIERWPAARTMDEVDVDGQRIAVKVTAGRAKVEHDDAARAARALGLPLREVVSLAEEAWRRRSAADDQAGRLPPPPDGEPA